MHPVLIFLTFVLALHPVGSAEAARRHEPPLDLAAMRLLPADLPEQGYGLSGGGLLQTLEEAYPGADEAERREALADFGWQRQYDGGLALPDGAGDGDPRPLLFVVTTTVTEYADANGAADAFAFTAVDPDDIPEGLELEVPDEVDLEVPDEVDLEVLRDVELEVTDEVEFEVIDEVERIGDESQLLHLTIAPKEDEEDGLEIFILGFRDGALIAQVMLFYFTDAEVTADEDEAVEEIEELAATLLERIEEVRDADEAGLSVQVLRLDPAGEVPLYDSSDGYRRLAGEIFPLRGESEQELEERAELQGEATDLYRLVHWIQAGDEPAFATDPGYIVALLRFPDEDAGADWLEEVADTLQDAIDVESVEHATTFGDESSVWTYTFEREGADEPLRGYDVLVRLGPVVALVQLFGPQSMPVSAVEELVDAQVACLAAEACPDPAPVPEDLLDLLDEPAEEVENDR